jgi:hypothetical protein
LVLSGTDVVVGVSTGGAIGGGEYIRGHEARKGVLAVSVEIRLDLNSSFRG